MRKHDAAKVSALFLTLMFTLCISCGEKKEKSDEEITNSITSTTMVIDKNIRASVREGVVTLDGEVADDETRTAAINAVKHIEGVKSINSNLTVKTVTATNPQMSQSDRDLKRAVDSTLASHQFTGIDITVSNGSVTLKGDVTHEEEVAILKLVGELHPAQLENFLTVTNKQQ